MSFVEQEAVEHRFVTRALELVDAVKATFGPSRATFPALLLMYATIDILSALSRPRDHVETSGPVFQRWIGEYLLPDSGLNCTAEDIWAARCGLLHTLSLSSRLSRAGRAKPICYINRQDGVERMQQFCDGKGHDVVVVSLENYVAAFYQAVLRFTERISKDAELRERVFHHMGDVAEEITFRFRDESEPQR
jgi:hypothetical protein